MEIVFFDDQEIRKALLPLTFTRPVAEIRVGILTIREKWMFHLISNIFTYQTEAYLNVMYPAPKKGTLFINGAVCPSDALRAEIGKLQIGDALYHKDILVAYHTSIKNKIEYDTALTIIQRPADIFAQNGAEIKEDYKRITKVRTSKKIEDKHTLIYNEANIFVEEGVKVRAAIINAEEGPVYLGQNVEIQEGAIIKGPFAAMDGSVVAMGARMRGDVTLGPQCKVGGEVSNTIFFGYSNKVHDGFIGNSVIGEWCNLAAGTNISNLKNNYSEVSVYSYRTGKQENSGRIFHGLVMGDYSRCGINAMFNTGSVIGTYCNIYDAGFPPKFVPSFAWGSSNGFQEYRLEDAKMMASRAMERRNKEYSAADSSIADAIFEIEKKNRQDLLS
jgi:UDP-N-acetylglucosamine diphosphorylase/glucosamine-1-phosphate N-acetyltransferase